MNRDEREDPETVREDPPEHPRLRPGGHPAEARPLAPGLYLVGTPIGNLQDITLRALRVLEAVDRIACEDTRTTRKLLHRYGISKPTVSCHQHNEDARASEIVGLIREGGKVALVSDAGTPGICDPGAYLVRAAVAAGLPIVPIPGASAALTALVASGLRTERFLFAGFLESRPLARRGQLQELASMHKTAPTLVLYEAPHRILETLADVEAIWGAQTQIAVAREMTKLHEEFLRGTVAEVSQALAARERVKGELVLLIENLPRLEPAEAASSLNDRLRDLARSEGLEEKEALKRVARERGLSKSALYRELQQERRKR